MKVYSNVFELMRDLGAKLSLEYEYLISLKAQIGGQLMAYRKRYDLTQEDMAKYLEIDLKTYQAIEEGEYDLKISEIAKIFSKLGLQPRLEFEQKYYPEFVDIKDYKGLKVIKIKTHYFAYEMKPTIEALLKDKYHGKVLIDQSKAQEYDPTQQFIEAYFDGKELQTDSFRCVQLPPELKEELDKLFENSTK
ncbi:MAG TPA: XRE family transcriptional regulator [Thermotogaceae bacterium]|nr:XRE family transcriptional regulator [Thermotogaceae bacterium]